MKIPIFCSLLPTELIISLGHEAHFVKADELEKFKTSEHHCAFHENLCSYSKVLHDYFVGNHSKFDLIIIPTSCDALKKLSNALHEIVPAEKLYVLDVPQNKGASAERYLAMQLRKLVSEIEKEPSQKVTLTPIPTLSPQRRECKIGILGANVPLKVLENSLNKFNLEAIYLNHCLVKSYSDNELKAIARKEDIEGYAHEFLKKNSCPRTNDYNYKKELKDRIQSEDIKGLIINTLKFCDFQHFDYRYFKKELEIPMLILEHELEANYEGQIMTRLEAFFEGITKKTKTKNKAPDGLKGFFVGIDSGSHATKLVCIDGEGKIVSKQIATTGTSVKKSVRKVLSELAKDGIDRKKITRIVATGYGRNNVEDADEIITEISCHAVGAHHILGRGGTIIDIGGQDSKAIRIDDEGRVVQFAMNDKCAAGTGRFLEVMANKLEMGLEDFAKLALNANKSVLVSSMCSVFAESEVISLIASGKSKEEIAKGIHKAIADRTASLSRRVNGMPPYYMAGGVSKNGSLVRELEDCLGSKIEVIEGPQFTGALGAALFALKGC